MARRIDTTSSNTAAWTCVSRAASSLEEDSHYRSNDDLARALVPRLLGILLRIPLTRRLFFRIFAPPGIYEYVIARTKYIDTVWLDALSAGFEQILLFGAGFDTRALRFHAQAGDTKVYELDVPSTQHAKLDQYRKRGLSIPSGVEFIGIDFDKDSLRERLDEAGFREGMRTLFVLEGLVMYLQPESVHETFEVIRDLAGPSSQVVFDAVRASVLRGEGTTYGEADIVRTVAGADEKWQFAIEDGEIESFLSAHELRLLDLRDARALEEMYFTDQQGKLVGRMNGTHVLVLAERA
jgi:methyltransferase (TIGR00027 family)